MAERGITTAAELQRRLRAIGVNVSSQNMARLVRYNPNRISTEILYGLTEVLECSTADLLVNPNHIGAVPSIYQTNVSTPARPNQPKPNSQKQSYEEGVGPTLKPFPTDRNEPES